MKIYDIAGNSQSLDGGAMFGNAPKALWSRWFPADESNRIALATRAMLVDTGDQRVLLETGVGCFFEPQLRERYGVIEDEHVLLASLAKVGVAPEEIDAVILSHLHFDHAGGLLSTHVEGAAPSLVFPNAQFVVGQTAFERAMQPHPRDRASFIPALQPLLQASGRLHLLADDQVQSELLGDAFRFRVSHGHTPGMLLTQVNGAHQQVFFCADLIPARAWVHLPITMGYDRFPERLIDEKAELLPQFERERTWLYFTHDPEVAAARIQRDNKGKFTVAEQRSTFQDGWDLDAA